MRKLCRPEKEGGLSIGHLTLRWGCQNHALRQVANLFNKVFYCIQRHATMFVQVYGNPFIGERIMIIYKLEVRLQLGRT